MVRHSSARDDRPAEALGITLSQGCTPDLQAARDYKLTVLDWFPPYRVFGTLCSGNCGMVKSTSTLSALNE